MIIIKKINGLGVGRCERFWNPPIRACLMEL